MFLESLKLPDKFEWWDVRSTLEEWVFKLVNNDQFVMPGTVVLFASTTIPEGWVECDNASYDRTKFPDLFKAIGTTYGSTATTFNVPPTPYVAPANMVWMIKT